MSSISFKPEMLAILSSATVGAILSLDANIHTLYNATEDPAPNKEDLIHDLKTIVESLVSASQKANHLDAIAEIVKGFNNRRAVAGDWVIEAMTDEEISRIYTLAGGVPEHGS